MSPKGRRRNVKRKTKKKGRPKQSDSKIEMETDSNLESKTKKKGKRKRSDSDMEMEI